ncbi:MAG: CPBP family intramembrane metalloprotease [Oscillospiraceae bacterium]|nr:CPBP family intramembrane metalloprotease [Oscillospiraceae bacterium]
MRKPSYAHNSLSRAETVFGWLYLPFHFSLLSSFLNLLLQMLHLQLSTLELNLVYYSISFAAIAICFRRFLSQRFFGGRFWNFVQACILGAVMHYLGGWLIRFLADLFRHTLPMYNNDVVSSFVLSRPKLMIAFTVLLMPIVEETLFRGVVFGSLLRCSRALAYIASVLLFAFLHTWQFFFTNPLWDVLLSTLLYLPAGIALAWTYDRADTIWAPITLHAIINAVSFGLVAF